MLSEWSTYRLSDFLLFSERVYRRLFEVHNEAWWALPIVFATAGLLGLAIAVRTPGEPRLDGSGIAVVLWIGLGSVWLFVALAFLHARYLPINPIASIGAWAFAAQAVALAALAFTGRAETGMLRRVVGAAFIVWGVVLYPAWAFWRDGSLAAAEWFGMAPDPTAVATIGFIVAAVRGRALATLLCLVPIAWCTASALTLRAMDERQIEGNAAPRLGVVTQAATAGSPVTRQGGMVHA